MDVFAALSDPVRRSLLRSLGSGPARVVDLAVGHPISRPAVSKHLRLLTEAGLVTARDHGRERHYSVTPEGLSPVVELVTELVTGPSQPKGSRPVGTAALAALDTEVRRTTRDRRAAERRPAKHHRHEQEETA